MAIARDRLVAERSGARATAAAQSDGALGVAARLRIGFVRLLLCCVLEVGGLAALWRVAQFCGRMEYQFCHRRRRRVRRALQSQIANARELDIERCVRRWFRRMRCDRWFYLIADRVPRAELVARVAIVGEEHLRDAVGQGRGVMALLSHHGSHDLLPVLIGGRGYRCAGIRARENRAARAYMQPRLAESLPELAEFETGLTASFPRQVLRWLGQGAIVGCAVDVIPPGFGQLRSVTTTDVHGRSRPFLTGPLRIARQQGAAVVQALLVSEPQYRFRVIVEPIAPEATLEQAAAIYAARVCAWEDARPDHLSRF